MTGNLSPTEPHGLTVIGLAVGAIGIAILWASGVEFPFYPPPGLVILAVGAAFVALAKWRWAPGVGAFLGLFVIVGFVISSLVSGEAIDNLFGEAGTGPVIGSAIQLIGVTTALIAGVLAVRQARSDRA
ncbi:MAG: hypothetical protein ACRD29_14110 [Acidimicrobiales bacterium]